MNSFASNLNRFRIRKNLSRAELSAMLHMSRPVVGTYERGECEPSIDTLLQMGDALDVDMNEPLGYDRKSPDGAVDTEGAGQVYGSASILSE
ncbi:MAG: helix-turn-helix transcriptional regulator [Ruminococcaceae bacterium]|nr:helix-turn-helix transcriptional regulator [Oscillospiraceae bacterium]